MQADKECLLVFLISLAGIYRIDSLYPFVYVPLRAAAGVDSQDIAVGGFFNRNNTLYYKVTTVTVTNNGPTS